jgi:hypothetical protein
VREHLRKLRVILPVISVSVMALHRQNAELDHDIATVLAEHACEPLDFEIEHLAAILAAVSCRRYSQELAKALLAAFEVARPAQLIRSVPLICIEYQRGSVVLLCESCPRRQLPRNPW